MPYISDEFGGGHGRPEQHVPSAYAPAANFTGDQFEVTDAKTRYAARKFAEWVEQVNAIPNLDERAKAQAIESFANTEAARDAEASISAAQAHRDQLAAQPDTEQAKHATASDAGAQMKAGRDWDRYR